MKLMRLVFYFERMSQTFQYGCIPGLNCKGSYVRNYLWASFEDDEQYAYGTRYPLKLKAII